MRLKTWHARFWLCSTAMLLASAFVPAGAVAQSSDQAGSEPGIVDLDAVTVTADSDIPAARARSATKTDAPLLTVPQSVSVVTGAQMRDWGVDNVGQGLSYTPGVFADQRPDSLYDGLFLRGFGGFGGLADFDKFYDGLKLPTAQYLGSASVDPYTLERVTVIKGPASVLYGGASPGGIVDLISKKPTGSTFGEAGATFGNQSRAEGFVDVGGVFDPAGNAQYRMVALGRLLDAQEDGAPDQQHLVIAPSLRLRLDDATVLTLLLNYQNDPDAYYASWVPAAGTVLPGTAGKISRNAYMGNSGYDAFSREQVFAGYELERDLGNGLKFRQNLKYADIDQSYTGLVANYQTPFNASGQINRWAVGTQEGISSIAVDNQLTYQFAAAGMAHEVLVGLSAETARSNYVYDLGNGPALSLPILPSPLDSLSLSRIADQSVTSRQLGLYAQDQVRIGKLSLLFGGRQDWVDMETDSALSSLTSSQSDAAFSGRVGASYEVVPGLAPYVSFATSFQPIIGTDANGAAYEPSRGVQREVGVKYQSDELRAFVTAAAFDIEQTNVRTMAPSGLGYIQTGEVRSRGFEFEAHIEPVDGFKLIASYAYVDAVVTADEDAAIIGNHPSSIPENMASLWISYNFKGGPWSGLTLGSGIRYVGSSEGDAANDFSVPAVTLLDAALNWNVGQTYPTLKGLEADLNVRNIMDTEYVASCFSIGGCFFGQGRMISLSLKRSW